MGFFIAALTTIIGLSAAFHLRRRLKQMTREKLTFDKMNAKLEADLADRRQIERELAHMASFADMAPNPIVEINPDGSVGYQNPAAEKDFPTLLEEAATHPLFEGLSAAVELLTREKRELMTRPLRVGQRVYDQQISLLNGGPRVRLYMSDITELKRLDQLKSDFVNMVSHELRTPLTTMGASIKMVAAGLMGDLTTEQRDALGLAQNSIDRLARMINDLLDVSKIEAGKLEIHRARVDLVALIREVCASFEPLAKERGLQIKMDVTDAHLETLIDRDKILQVFTNLMNNALKFTEKGHVKVSAVLQETGVRCKVADTGPGIAPAGLPKLFGKFHQVGNAPKGREKGTGLGLSLCKGFVELHGGTIWVESRPKEGTEFIFHLPNLGAKEIFRDRVQPLFSEAVARGKALSLLRLSFPEWKTFCAQSEEENIRSTTNELQDFVKTTVRSDSDPVFQKDGVILLALVDADRATAAEIGERIVKNWHESAFVQSLKLFSPPAIQIVSYPEDSSLIEELLARL